MLWCPKIQSPSPNTITNIYIYIYIYYRRKFRSQTSDNIDRWKSRGRKSQRGEEHKREDQRRERVRRKKMQVREKVGKPPQNTMFFQWFVAPEGRKVGSLMGAEPSGQMRDEKVHAVVARSTCGSERAKNTSPSEHFWTLSCPKSARRCGAKHIWKSKWTKHTMFGPLFEVAMFKKCTPLWRGAHSEVKMYKTHHVQNTFGSWDVEKAYAVVAWSTYRSQNVQKTSALSNFGSSDV